MTDRSFASEAREILEIASSLLHETNTEDTRIYVQGQLQELRSFLQEKQIQGEKALKDSIKDEYERIKDLEERINGLNDGTVQEADKLDYREMYDDLKETEWVEAFHALLEDKRRSVESILSCLINILKITYTRCHALQARHNLKLSAEAICAGDQSAANTHFKRLTEEQVKELNDHVAYCQKQTTQFCVMSISKKLLDEVKSDKELTKMYRKQSERVVSAFDAYITACIRFAWVTQLETPPIRLVTAPKTECPPIMDQFIDRKIVPYAKYVEWPALVQGVSSKDRDSVIQIPWQLCDKSKPRPTARPAKIQTPPPPIKSVPRTEVMSEWNDDYDQQESESSVQLDGNMAINLPHPPTDTDQTAIRQKSREHGGDTAENSRESGLGKPETKPIKQKKKKTDSGKHRVSHPGPSGNQKSPRNIAAKNSRGERDAHPHASQNIHSF